MNWCILIPIIVGILCAILGYLLGKLLGKRNTYQIEEWKERYEALETKYRNTVDQLTTSEADLAVCRANLTATVDEVRSIEEVQTSEPSFSKLVTPFNATLAKTVFGKKIKEDDLKIVEGIGPKIEQLFHEHEIKTWKSLSECSLEKCQEILHTGGKRFGIHNPGTWPQQAKLAYEGKWEELQKWQDELDGGRL